MIKTFYTLILAIVSHLWLSNAVIAKGNILRIGIFPRFSAKLTMKKFMPFAKYLSSITGKKVVIVPAKNFAVFWDNTMKNKYDLVHYNQWHYIESNLKKGYRVIAQNEEFSLKKIRGAFVVRKDSYIDSVKDLKYKTILFGAGKKAFLINVVNKVTLSQAGLSSKDYISKSAKNPPNSTLATYLKQADAASLADIGLKLPILKKIGVDVSELKIIGLSQPFSHLPWAVNRSMDDKLARTIQNAMVTLTNSEQGKKVLKSTGFTAFNIAEDKDYDSSREIIAAFKNIK